MDKMEKGKEKQLRPSCCAFPLIYLCTEQGKDNLCFEQKTSPYGEQARHFQTPLHEYYSQPGSNQKASSVNTINTGAETELYFC